MGELFANYEEKMGKFRENAKFLKTFSQVSRSSKLTIHIPFCKVASEAATVLNHSCEILIPGSPSKPFNKGPLFLQYL